MANSSLQMLKHVGFFVFHVLCFERIHRAESSKRKHNREETQKRPYLKKHLESWLENFSPFGWGCHFSHPACVLLLPPSGRHRIVGKDRRKGEERAMLSTLSQSCFHRRGLCGRRWKGKLIQTGSCEVQPGFQGTECNMRALVTNKHCCQISAPHLKNLSNLSHL